MKKLLLPLFLAVSCAFSYAQSLIFAELQGQPTVNTTGWNLTGAATPGDTPGDADANSNELILTQAINASSGGIFYNQIIDLGTCTKWTVDFDFRIFNGTGADGIAFCFLDVPPTGFVSGGGVGIPSSANGLKVVFDTYDNGCGANPEIQIYSGAGYGECNAGIVKLNNSGGSLNFIRSNAYNTARITYDNGNITVTVNGTPYLTANFPITFPGYMGFTASTGGSNDQHSVKNVTIYADIALSDAGLDQNYCTGGTPQIGTASNATYTYSWTPATGLSNAAISNPTVTTVNNTTAPIVQQYIVETYLTSNLGACPTYDTVLVTVNPLYTGSVNASICQGTSYSFGSQNYTVTGNYPVTFQSVSGCDSTVTLNLTVNPTYNLTQNATICQGGSYTFGGTNYSVAGDYPVTFQTVNGCDSVVTLHLVVNPAFTSDNYQTICQGGSYVFDGTAYSTAGNYAGTFQTVSGCDSLVTLHLTVNPAFQSTQTETICQGETFTIGGNNYTSSGTYTVNMQTSTGCDSTVTLNLTVNPVFTSSHNEEICQGETFAFGGQNFTTTGTYPITFQAVNGCDSVATLHLLVRPTFSHTVNETICQGGSIVFSGQTFTAAGTYPLTFQSVYGCDSVETLVLTVNPIPPAPIIVTNSPVLCPGDQFALTLSAQINATCTWIGPNNFTSMNPILNFVASEANTGIYAATVTVNGCTSPPTSVTLDIVGSDSIAPFDFPNVITMNGDKINDSLDVDQFFNPCVNYELVIWNRWGNVIYKQSYGTEPFSGQDQQGNNVSHGVYFYKLTYQEFEKTGSITIVR